MGQGVRVVRGGALEAAPPTPGMIRKQASLAENAWAVELRTEPHTFSGWHHHGEYTTCGFLLSGQLRFEFGAGGQESVDLAPGDFFMVPPHTVHREGNPGPEEQLLVGVRIGTGPTVINMDGPEPA